MSRSALLVFAVFMIPCAQIVGVKEQNENGRRKCPTMFMCPPPTGENISIYA